MQNNVTNANQLTNKLTKLKNYPDYLKKLSTDKIHKLSNQLLTDKKENDNLELATDKLNDKKARLHKTLNSIPEKYKLSTFENYKTETQEEERNLQIAQRFAHDFKRARSSGGGLLMYGNTGTGKTSLAFAIMRYVVQAGYSAYYEKATQLIDNVWSFYNRDAGSPTRREIRQTYTLPDLLVVDELGHQTDKKSALDELFDVLDDRKMENRPTIFISNYDIDEVKKYLNGDAGFSRAMAGGVSLVFTGRDRRIT